MSNIKITARPDSWKTIPMPEIVTSIPFQSFYSAQEMERIRLGLVPKAMEDKWFLYMTEDTLFAHRSWTGFCIYRVHFTAENDGYIASEAIVNRDPEQFKGKDDNYDALLLKFLIDNLLLEKHTVFPVPAGLPSSAPAGLYQHHIAGTGYPEIRIEEQGASEG